MIATNDLEEVAIRLSRQLASRKIDERLEQALVEQRLADNSLSTDSLEDILDVFNGENPVFKEVYGAEINLYRTPSQDVKLSQRDMNRVILKYLGNNYSVSKRTMALMYFLLNKTQMIVKNPLFNDNLIQHKDLYINKLEDVYIEKVFKAMDHYATINISDAFGTNLALEHTRVQYGVYKTVGDYLDKLYEFSKYLDRLMTFNACEYLNGSCYLVFSPVLSKRIRMELRF